MNFRCKIGSATELITFQVIDRQANPILGLNDALRLRLVELDKAVYKIGCENNDDFSKQITTEYADLFDEQLGTLPATYIMRVDPTVSPVVKPARKIPQTMEKKVKEELDNMVKKGVIIRETEPTEWVSQMVAARKKNGDVRICLDPRDLNKALHRPHYPMRTTWPLGLGMPKFSQPSMPKRASGKSDWIRSPPCAQLSAHHSAGTDSSACPSA